MNHLQEFAEFCSLETREYDGKCLGIVCRSSSSMFFKFLTYAAEYCTLYDLDTNVFLDQLADCLRDFDPIMLEGNKYLFVFPSSPYRKEV